MSIIVITGCNRGIGLELCRQLADRDNTVIAAVRSSSAALEALDIEVVAGIDVADAATLPRLREAVGDRRVDVLINNAGILLPDSLGEIDYDALRRQFEVNTLGPLRVTESLLDHLAEGAKIIIVSSRVGSIGDNASGGNYGYRASKTAVNQIGTNLMHDLRPRGIAVALLHPGLVATRMTGSQGIEPAESAAGLIRCIERLNLGSSGAFWHAEGYELPW